MDKQKNIENAKAVFVKSNIPAMFFTNDGQGFYGLQPASVHQKELTGSTNGIHKVNNGNYAEQSVEVVEDTVSMDEETTEATTETKTKKAKKETA